MNDDLTDRIAAFLDAHHVMSLATLGPDGPHAANVFYVRDELDLIWVSDPASRHSVHIEARPDVAATIAPDYCDFPEIQGLQVSGQARKLRSQPERARARGRLQTRYPFLRSVSAGPRELRDAYDRAQFYRLEPARIVLTDNRRGFGSKEVLDLDSRPSPETNERPGDANAQVAGERRVRPFVSTIAMLAVEEMVHIDRQDAVEVWLTSINFSRGRLPYR